MALLQVHQAKALRDLHEGGHDLAVLHELRAATDLALRATKVTVQSLGRAMSTLVVQECHLWLCLNDMKEQEKVQFLNAPVSQTGLFGDAVESCAQQFSAAQKQTEAIKHIMRRRKPAAASTPAAAPQPARRRGRPPVATHAARPPKFRGIRFTSVKPADAPVLRAEIAVLLAKDAIEPVPPADMRSGLFSPDFIVPKKGGGLRPILDLSFEPCTSQAAVQDVDAETHFWMLPSPRLVCSNRPEGRVLSCLEPPATQAIPAFRVRGTGVSVQGPALRAVPVASRLHQSRGGGPCPPERTRCAHSQLPQRLAHTHTVSQAVVCTQGPGAQAPQPAGPSGQLGKEQTRANAEDLFSRIPRWAWKCGTYRVQITPACRKTFRPWSDPSFLRAGVPLEQVSRHAVVFTDASTTGWGATYNGHAVSGVWTGPQLHWHINCLELLAVRLALSRLRGRLQHKDVLVRTDNTATVAYINRQVGLRSRRMSQLARHLLLWSQKHLRSLRAIHIPGVFNRAADELSRAALPGEWRLHPQAVQLIWGRFGAAQVDLFASPETTHCQEFYSLTEATLGTDALAHSWPRGLRKYAFPPVSLLAQTLCKIREDEEQVLLVAPYWPNRTWFPELMLLATAPPWPIPLRKDLLS